jgi:hypothetical protein
MDSEFKIPHHPGKPPEEVHLLPASRAGRRLKGGMGEKKILGNEQL